MPYRRNGCCPSCGGSTSVPTPTWSTCTCVGSERSWIPTPCAPSEAEAMGSISIDASGTAGAARERAEHPADPISWLRAFLARRWVEVLWVAFVIVNTAGILRFSDWATVPFHFVWIGLSLLYGWRVWGMRAMLAALAAVIVLPGIALVVDVIYGDSRV